MGGVTVGRLGEETPEAFAHNRLGDLWDTEPLMVLNDEGHHAYRPAPVPEGVKLSATEKADREEATVLIANHFVRFIAMNPDLPCKSPFSAEQ